MTIESFVGEYHEIKAKDSGNGTQRPLPFTGLGPLPQLLAWEDKPHVVYWERDSYSNTPGVNERGETDANATSIPGKRQVRHPRKSTVNDDDEEDDNNGDGDGDSDNITPVAGSKPKHRYLEKEDSTPISTLDLQLLGNKAQQCWVTMLDYDYAPKTWGKMSSVAWEFYFRSLLNEPGLEFLRLCEDSQWKQISNWTQQSYSRWSARKGVREVHPKMNKKEARKSAVPHTLDNKELFQIEPNDQEPEVPNSAKDSADLHHIADVQDPERGKSVQKISNSKRDSMTKVVPLNTDLGANLRENQHQPVSTHSHLPPRPHWHTHRLCQPYWLGSLLCNMLLTSISSQLTFTWVPCPV